MNSVSVQLIINMVTIYKNIMYHYSWNKNKTKHINLFGCFVLLFCAQSVCATQVVLGTKYGGTIAGLTFSSGDLVRYDMELGTAQIYFSESNFTATGQDINPDALHIRDNGNLVMSGRRPLELAGTYFTQYVLAEYDLIADAVSILLPSHGPDLSAVDILSNGNILFAAKWGGTLGGQSYGVGDVVEYDPVAGSASIFFSASNFFTIDDGGTRAVGNIDAIDVLANGNLLLSTTNTADIGTSLENRFKVRQGGVYEYDFATGGVTEFFSPDLFAATSDIKSFSLLPSNLIATPLPSALMLFMSAGAILGLFRSTRRGLN